MPDFEELQIVVGPDSIFSMIPDYQLDYVLHIENNINMLGSQQTIFCVRYF